MKDSGKCAKGYVLSEKTRKEAVEFLREHLNERRFKHSLGVEAAAVELAERFGEDPERARTAGLLHDSGKYLPKEQRLRWMEEHGVTDPVFLTQTDLIHGYISAELAQERFGVTDEATLDAIRYHTTGRRGSTGLERVVYVADLIEPNRDFEGVDALREQAEVSLEDAMLASLKEELSFVIERDKPMCGLSVDAYNELILEKRRKERREEEKNGESQEN